MEQKENKKLKNWVVIDSEVYEYTVLPLSALTKKHQLVCHHCDLFDRNRACVEFCFLYGNSPRGCFKKIGKLTD